MPAWRSKILVRLGLALILGLATTIAVAWGLGAWLRWHEPGAIGTYLTPRGGDEASVHVWQVRQRGGLRRSVATYGTRLWKEPAGELPFTMSYRIANDEELDASWGRLKEAMRAPEVKVEAVEEARGWPWLCVWCWREPGFSNVVRVHGGIAIKDPRVFWQDADHQPVIPLMPIWKGLFAGAAFYGGIWCVLLFGVSGIRSLARRRRGHCPACGYDLKHDRKGGCPECGWNRGDGGVKRPAE